MKTMRSLIFSALIASSAFLSVAQEKTGQPFPGKDSGPALRSRIIRVNSTDTVMQPVLMHNADYDLSRKNLPFFILHKTTPYNQSATPTLQVRRFSVVPDNQAAVIRKYFSQFLTTRFEIEAVSSVARDENLNICKLVPFRLNALGQIEELLDYQVSWQIGPNPQTTAGKGSGTASFKSSSVLSSGNWYKIAVSREGIYRINKGFLSNMGVDLTGVDPRNIRIYGNGGKMLPEKNGDPRIDDLEENAIKVVGEQDGVFDNADYILFYGASTTDWKRIKTTKGIKFRPTKSLYSDSAYYFLTTDLGPGKRVSSAPNLQGQANRTSTSYDYYNFHEANIVNFGKSGRENYGEFFDINNSYRFSWDDGSFVTGDTLAVEVSLAAAHKDNSEFGVTGNGQNFKVITGGVSGLQYSDYAAHGSNAGISVNPDANEIGITVTRLTSKSLGWLDKINVNARRNLNVSARQFTFRDTRVTAPGNITQFKISMPANSVLTVWNITDPLNPVEQVVNSGAVGVDFTAATSSLQEFCVAPSTDYLMPVSNGRIENQNLHAISEAQYIIVTHPLFLAEAKRLGAFHQKQDNLSYVVVTTEEIYNEFSSGKQDIAAIRDFIRMLYTRNKGTSKAVKYAVLIGDGSYNNMSRNLVNNSNFIPTYQSHESLSSTSSVATDDFYALMDPDEGFKAENSGKIDIGVGRFPCRTVTEVRGILSKIENYYTKDLNFEATINDPQSNSSESIMSDWRNWLVFLGDDQDNAEHMKQADSLTKIVKRIDESFNYDKILLDAYQRFSTPGGPRYPDASSDFLKRIKKGALIFNYTGHGGEVGLTAERMIDIDIINGLDNFNKLPLFITATCEFSRYDDPARTSAGELCLLNPKGGAIALFTTCRLAYSNYNFSLNIVALEKLFQRMTNGSRPTLGEAIQLTKSDPRVSITYITNFHLLGDPALRLAYPHDKVVTTHINNSAVSSVKVDTLGALAKITVTGYVADLAGNKKSNFNGIAYPTVFDKEQLITSLLNTPESATNYYSINYYPDSTTYRPFTFNLQKNILYRGKAKVTNGDFSFSFIVPKDISFAIGPGKISYYATDGQTDASGSYTQVVVGGASKNILPDNEGPQVQLYFNHKNFVNGGITNEDPILFADLTDSSGVNTLGSGLGHDISAVLDNQTTKPIVLNDYYEANLNTYQGGRVRYPFNDLPDGEHRISFKVWDIQNNSTVVHADFVVAKSAELALKHVLNYPNPFTTRTKFYFEHNQACNPLKVTIQVYSVSGKLVKTLQKTIVCEGFKPEGIDWDGRDDYGDKLARGVYIYRLGILDVENKKAEKIEKLVILN